ncbi:uncharacterized protein [Aegilops tauschii subsp. strangulata]|uniref:uncharacterized protein isoform X3 n=1 Tax=Aegilops tauschii subsp. strangulata TaxID=200361 RepID=UPI003CC8C9B8
MLYRAGDLSVLAKHSAKEELPIEDKSKLRLDLESYVALTAGDIHAGYLNRLHTSREMEDVLVNLVKERYEAELIMQQSQVGDLKKNIKTQQAESSKTKSELKASLEAAEKLKADFDIKRADWEIEKAVLAKRAEDVEAALKPMTGELSGLKQHIIQMTAAILAQGVPTLAKTCY